MGGFADFANGLGFLYITGPIGTTADLIETKTNTQASAQEILDDATFAGSLSGDRSAFGSITVDDLTGAVGEDITQITIDGVNQITGVISVGSTDTEAYAAQMCGFLRHHKSWHFETHILNCQYLIQPQ